MKKLTTTLAVAAFIFATTLNAQEPVKTTPKKATATKAQEDKKKPVKADTTKGKERMAINEKGTAKDKEVQRINTAQPARKTATKKDTTSK